MSMFNFHPYKGETIYSLLSRANLIYGNPSSSSISSKLTGAALYSARSGLPTHLKAISRSLDLAEDSDWLCANNTLYPLFAHFICSERREALANAMSNSGSANAQVGTRTLARHQDNHCRICSACMQEDIEKIGVALWRREHMLEATHICPIHGIPLSLPMQQGRAFRLPPDSRRDFHSVTDEQTERLIYISESIKALIERPAHRTLDSAYYRVLINESGFLTKGGRLRLTALKSAITNWLYPIRKIGAFEKLVHELKTRKPWAAKLVDPRNELQHPIKHIVTWGALGLNIDDIFNTEFSLSQQMELPLNQKEALILDRELISETLDIYHSYAASAKALNVNLTSLLMAAEQQGLAIKRRPRKLTPALRILVLAEPKDASTAEIAIKHGISVSSVYRIRRSKQH